MTTNINKYLLPTKELRTATINKRASHFSYSQVAAFHGAHAPHGVQGVEEVFAVFGSQGADFALHVERVNRGAFAVTCKKEQRKESDEASTSAKSKSNREVKRKKRRAGGARSNISNSAVVNNSSEDVARAANTRARSFTCPRKSRHGRRHRALNRATLET